MVLRYALSPMNPQVAKEWTFKFYQGCFAGKDVRCSWLSSFVKPGQFLAHQDTSRLLRVVASAEFAILALEASVQEMENGTTAFVCRPSSAGLGWRHVVSLQDWLALQLLACFLRLALLAGFRPWFSVGKLSDMRCRLLIENLLSLMFISIFEVVKPYVHKHFLKLFICLTEYVRKGEPKFLPQSLCLSGLQLNKEQLISLIHELGGKPPQGATKKQLQLFIINGLLTGDANKACADDLEKQAAA